MLVEKPRGSLDANKVTLVILSKRSAHVAWGPQDQSEARHRGAKHESQGSGGKGTYESQDDQGYRQRLTQSPAKQAEQSEGRPSKLKKQLNSESPR